MKLITNKSKNLLYRISSDSNTTIQFSTSYAVVTQTIADTDSLLSFKFQGYKSKSQSYTHIFSDERISSTGVFTKTFTTPSTTGFDLIRFGLNGAKYDTCANCKIDLKPSTTYTFTCNFTNITQGSVSWKDMMLVEGSTAGEYEPYSYNLLNKWQYSATQTINGVVITNNNDGSYTFDGTATDNSYFNYYVLGKDLRGGVVDGSISNGYYAKDVTYDHSNGIAYYYFSKDTIFNNTLIIPQLYDLTLMYGAGNEPTTVDQFFTDHPELKVSPLGFIGLKNLEISNKNIKRLRYATTTRNLFDKNIGLKLENDCKVSYSGNAISFTSLGGTATPRFMFNKITVEIGKTYTVSANWEQTDNSNALGLFISNENSADHSAYGVIDKTTRSRTFTATSTDLYLKGYVDYNKQISSVTISNLQIEEGSTATPYVPHGYLDLGIIPSNSGYILNKYDNLSEELLEENIEKDTVNYHIPDKTNILLNKVEGNTKKVVQLLDKSKYGTAWNHDGINWTPYGAYGIIHCVGKNTGTQYNAFHLSDSWDMNDIVFDDHKYILLTGLKQTYPSFEAGWFCGYSNEDGTTGYEWYSSTGIDQTNLNVFTIRKHNYTWRRIELRVSYGNEDTLDVWWTPQLFDLTAMYGRGNEPTTLEQFKQDYPQFFDEKLDGIWNVRTSGISTTGKNLFDISKWITSQYDVANGTLVERLSNGAICQGNNGTGNGSGNFSNGWFHPMNASPHSNQVHLQAGKYTLSADYTMIENSVVNTANVNCYLYGDHQYTNANTTSVTVGNTVKVKNTYTVEDGYYYPVFTLCSGKVKIENIQIELNSTVTDYEPYQENKIDLLSTQTLNGINGVNDYIEIIYKGNGLYDLKKTQNIDSVDLGTLNWATETVSSGINFYSTYTSDKVALSSYPMCQKYTSSSDSTYRNSVFFGRYSGALNITADGYDTAAAFKTAMNGVILYYQLKTPVTTTIATNLTYNQVSAIRTNGGLLLINDNNNKKYVQPNVTITENFQYKS